MLSHSKLSGDGEIIQTGYRHASSKEGEDAQLVTGNENAVENVIVGDEDEASLDGIDEIENIMPYELDLQSEMIAQDIDPKVVTIDGYKGAGENTLNHDTTLDDDLIIGDNDEITTMQWET